MSGDTSQTEPTQRLPDSLTDGRFEQWRVPLGLLALVVLLRPVIGHEFLLNYPPFANTILVWMLFAASFNVLLGYTGLLSFGHGMFLGFGAYGAAIGLTRFDLPFTVSAVIGLAVAAVVAYLIGRIIAQRGEIYFAMLTLAFAKAAHFIANQNYGGLTGGSTGIVGVLPSWIETQRGVKYVATGGFQFDWYYLLGTVFVLATLALWQIARSPFGRSLVAVRENEELARAVGIDDTRYKIWSFTFSGVFAALAGVLYAINNQGSSLSTLTVETSGDIILMTILGGANYFFGPLAGVFVWLFSEEFLIEFETLVLPLAEYPLVTIELGGLLSYWQFFLGLLFVISVLVAPREGLWGLFRSGIGGLYDRVRGGRE
ncbi:amino acid/amide ABC transporter membrane protein 2, HAAT family [Halomicrobium zhouii]|uniref:Amino acid/amide ABC transporter membrane protein 2, HAAT family n=1 Tax=Halomicrobium zhouii TaxID=767519 RepID=A0A1I6MA41_9EURY|nr:branched-chain amino acid ABC transporter permease [Halomicrobium zhouii]SFS12594.1 amino acid/amide ABC transporter membrane protein 2, HAAT family [Halomicrobium zhouii]